MPAFVAPLLVTALPSSPPPAPASTPSNRDQSLRSKPRGDDAALPYTADERATVGDDSDAPVGVLAPLAMVRRRDGDDTGDDANDDAADAAVCLSARPSARRMPGESMRC
jgi:hypothetical protein